jgi:hypothetical protein
LPLGVAADAVRNTIYFHGNDTAGNLWVLCAWAAAGIGLLVMHGSGRSVLLTHYGLRLRGAYRQS